MTRFEDVLCAALELPGHAAAGGVLRLQLRGATVDRLIKEIRLPAGPSPLARQEESNLGYALLRQWVPTAATRTSPAPARN